MSLKSILAGLAVVSFAALALNVVAVEKPAAAGATVAAPSATQELTLTGKLILKENVKADVKATDKVGAKEEVVKVKANETIVMKYALVEADGTEIALPEPKAKAGEKAIDMASLVGKTVKVVAKGKIKTVEGKKEVQVKSITSITEAAAEAAPAPEAK